MGVIVVGVDTSTGADAALRFAFDEARLRRARLRVVHAWHHGFVGAYGIESYPVFGGDSEELRKAAEAGLDATLEGVIPDAGEVEIERHVVEGQPAVVLVEESRGAILLVLGSRGHGGFAELLLGSVSNQCANHAHCPVLIARGSLENTD